MSKHREILELLFEEQERHDVNMRNNREVMAFFGSSEGLVIKEFTNESELYQELRDAGYSEQEASRAVVRERRKLGFGA